MLIVCHDESRHAATGEADFDRALAACDDHRIARVQVYTRSPKPAPPGWEPPAPRDFEGEWNESCAKIIKEWQKAGIPPIPTHFNLMEVEVGAARAEKDKAEKSDLDFVKGRAK